MPLDAINIQTHTATGSSPYELVFGQKQRSVFFPSKDNQGMILEEDLKCDGVLFESESTIISYNHYYTTSESVCFFSYSELVTPCFSTRLNEQGLNMSDQSIL